MVVRCNTVPDTLYVARHSMLCRSVSTTLAMGSVLTSPDRSIGAAGSVGDLKIGYDYGRSVTAMELEFDLSEEAMTENNCYQDDALIGATSAEVYIYIVSWLYSENEAGRKL